MIDSLYLYIRNYCIYVYQMDYSTSVFKKLRMMITYKIHIYIYIYIYVAKNLEVR